jgi:hypothetical protein
MRTRAAAIRRSPTGRPLRFVLLLLVLVTGCDGGRVILGSGGTTSQLRSGLYDYTAWSDVYRDEAWWGTFDLRIHSDGSISGTYRLPRQCVDHFGPGVDCVGRIGGRLYRDGTLRLGLDEGWLSHEGAVHRRSTVTGIWWSRLLGHRDEGTFELRRF